MFRSNRRLRANNLIDVAFRVGERPELGVWYVEAAYATTVSGKLLFFATFTNAQWSMFTHGRTLHVMSQYSTQ